MAGSKKIFNDVFILDHFKWKNFMRTNLSISPQARLHHKLGLSKVWPGPSGDTHLLH